MNVIIGGLLLAVSTFVGLKIADSYRKKLLFAQDFVGLLDLIETNILFMQDDLKKFLESKKDNFHKEFKAFLENFINNLNDSSVCLDNWKKEQNITSQETAELLVNFMKGLGRNDSTTQLQIIEQTKSILQKHLTQAQSEQKKGHLYSRLGIMGGLALFIIVL